MENIFHKLHWNPFGSFGLTSQFWQINVETVLFTWAALFALVVLIVAARIALKYRNSVGEHVVLSGTEALKDMVIQSLGTFDFNHFAFVSSLFCFILLCNILPLIPGLEEPTSDLSTTLGLGITSFCYVQGNSIKAHGLWGYLKEFAEPFFFMIPMHIVGTLTTIVSISFRLFGNIMGGSIISKIYLNAIGGYPVRELLGLFGGVNLFITLFLVLFEGLIQAFVFAMLSLTYLALAIRPEE